MVISKPQEKDLPDIKKILDQWTELEETDKYIGRIVNEINGKTEFSMRFWVIRNENSVVGIGGLADPLPKTLSFAKSIKSGEIKILYIDNDYRGKGIGKELMLFLENKAKEGGVTELLVRSAERYKDTAYGFYENMGYQKMGIIDQNMMVFRKLL